MKIFGGKRRLKSNSALAIAAGCAVAFMFIATVISIGIYQQRMDEAKELLAEAEYEQYDSYVIMISSNDSSDFWQEVYKSAKEYGAEQGVYVDMLSTSIDKSYSKAEYMEMAIESNCDAILLEGDDSPETAEMVAKAKHADIPVFTLESDIDMANRVSYIGANSYTIASLYGESLIENLTKQKKVMVLAGNTVNPTEASTFVNNMQSALDGRELPNGNLDFEVRTVESKDAFANEEYIQNLFKENDLAPVVICLDQESTESFYQAMIDYNKVGQIMLLGSNVSPTILTGIKQGVILSTVYVDAQSVGVSAAEAYIEYRDAGYVSDYISVDANVIDATNIDQAMEEVENE
jgi:ribose transport system substrate-binding protein